MANLPASSASNSSPIWPIITACATSCGWRRSATIAASARSGSTTTSVTATRWSSWPPSQHRCRFASAPRSWCRISIIPWTWRTPSPRYRNCAKAERSASASPAATSANRRSMSKRKSPWPWCSETTQFLRRALAGEEIPYAEFPMLGGILSPQSRGQIPARLQAAEPIQILRRRQRAASAAHVRPNHGRIAQLGNLHPNAQSRPLEGMLATAESAKEPKP